MARRIKNLSPEAKAVLAENQKRWHKENYDYINITTRKGLKEKYFALAEAHGLTFSTYVRDLLDVEYEKTFGRKIDDED